MYTFGYIALALLLAAMSPRAQRDVLVASAALLAVILIAAMTLPSQTVLIFKAIAWVAFAGEVLRRYHRLSGVPFACILLVLAGGILFLAWSQEAELVPFTSVPLVLSDILGVCAILCFGAAGMARICAWFGNLGLSVRGRLDRRTRGVARHSAR